MAPEASPWTLDKVVELRQLWADGLSGTDIAKRLGAGFTRCGVLGKVFRLNLPLRVNSPNGQRMNGPPKPRKPRPMIFPVSKDPQAPKPLPPEPPKPPQMRKLSLFKLENNHCRWPVGTPGRPGFCFCAADQLDGSPYCEYHDNIAYHRPKALRWGTIT